MKAEKIRRFLDENPQVFKRFEQESMKVIARGFKHYSAYTIKEVLRHQSALRADPDDEYKINNNIVPTIARDFMEAHPEAPENFFEMRTADAITKSGGGKEDL